MERSASTFAGRLLARAWSEMAMEKSLRTLIMRETNKKRKYSDRCVSAGDLVPRGTEPGSRLLACPTVLPFAVSRSEYKTKL